MDRQVMKAQLAQLKQDLDTKQKKLKMKAQLAQLKKDLEKKQRKLKNCETLARARDHVRQKILEQVELNKQTDSSSEPQHRQTRVKFGGREEFEVSRRIRRELKVEMGCDWVSHDTCQQHRKSSTCQDATSDTCQYEKNDTCQDATSDICQHASNDTRQHTMGDTCQDTVNDTCQHTMGDICQHETNDTCDICQNKTSDTCQHESSDTCQYTASDTKHDASDDISCVGQRARVTENHETKTGDVSAVTHTSVVSQDNVTAQSQQHVDIKSVDIKDAVSRCSTCTNHASDVSACETNTCVSNLVQRNVVSSSEIDTVPVISTGAGVTRVDRETTENCQGHQGSLNNQNSHVETGEAAMRKMVPFISVSVSDACIIPDVHRNKISSQETKTVSPVEELPVVNIPDGTPFNDVSKMSEEQNHSQRKNKLMADDNSPVARDKLYAEHNITDGGNQPADSQGCGGCEENMQDEDTSSHSQPLVVLHVKETTSSCVTPNVNSGDVSASTCHTPGSVSSLQLRKVSKRKSKGCDTATRRSSRLRSVAGDKMDSYESSESLTPKSLPCSDSMGAPRSVLSDLSSPVLDSETVSSWQSPVDSVSGSKSSSTRQGQGRGRRLRKLAASSHRYSTRHAARCSQESSQNTSDSPTLCGSPAVSLLPDIQQVLSSPQLSDVVYFSLPDGEFGGLKLQKAKQNALRKTTAMMEHGQSRRIATRHTHVKNGRTEQVAGVKSGVRSKCQGHPGLRDRGLGIKSCDNQSMTDDVCGVTMSDEGFLLQDDNSPIVFHSLKETTRRRSLDPQTNGPSEDRYATRRININKNKSSRGKQLRKTQTRSMVESQMKPSEKETSESASVGPETDDVIQEHGKRAISQDTNSTKPQPLETSSDGVCTGDQVCKSKSESSIRENESSNHIKVLQGQTEKLTQPRTDAQEDISVSVPQTLPGGDTTSTEVIEVTEVTDPVCDVQPQTETLLPHGSYPTEGGVVVSPKGVEVDGTCPNSLVTSCPQNTDTAKSIADRNCALSIDKAQLETDITESAGGATPTLFSENCPLKLVHSVRVNTDEEIVCVDARSGVTGDIVAYCTPCHVVLCRQATDNTYRQMTLGHCCQGSTFQRVHLLTSKKSIAVVAVLMSSCGAVQWELYKVTGREGVTMHPLEFNKLTDTPTPGIILSCLLTDLDLCLAMSDLDLSLATSKKFSTGLVRVTLARRLDGGFTETHLEVVSDALVSLCPVESLPGAVVGLSHTTVHVWNYQCGSLLVSAALPLEIDSCPQVCSEDGLLFCTVVCSHSAGVCLVAVNPNTLQTTLINRAITPTPLQQHSILQAAASSEVVCTLSANNLVALWSVYSATCLGFRPAVDATRVCFSDAVKTLMLASRHTVDIYSF